MVVMVVVVVVVVVGVVVVLAVALSVFVVWWCHATVFFLFSTFFGGRQGKK